MDIFYISKPILLIPNTMFTPTPPRKKTTRSTASESNNPNSPPAKSKYNENAPAKSLPAASISKDAAASHTEMPHIPKILSQQINRISLTQKRSPMIAPAHSIKSKLDGSTDQSAEQ
jgi:hypothetical protein